MCTKFGLRAGYDPHIMIPVDTPLDNSVVNHSYSIIILHYYNIFNKHKLNMKCPEKFLELSLGTDYLYLFKWAIYK